MKQKNKLISLIYEVIDVLGTVENNDDAKELASSIEEELNIILETPDSEICTLFVPWDKFR